MSSYAEEKVKIPSETSELHEKGFFFFYYSYVHTMFGSFLSPSPIPSLKSPPLPSPPTPLLACRNYFALISNFVEERL
jgi:hypothetical protein